MKYVLIILSVISLSLLSSCEKGVEIESGQQAIETLGLNNWTGHWDDLCSTGRTLTFIVTVNDVTEEHVISQDSGGAFTGEISEGDRVKVQVFDDNGTVFLNRDKNFTPSDPAQPSPTLNGAPYVEVCDIAVLDFYGF